MKNEIIAKFKDSPLGPIPKDWEVKRLGDVCDIQLGKMLDSAKNQGEECFYLTNKDVQWGYVSTNDLRCMPMGEDDKKKYLLEKGDLLVCEGGEVGRCAIWGSEIEECCFQKTIHRVRAKRNNDVCLQFLQPLLYCYAQKGVFAPYVSCTSIAHLTKDKFELLEIVLPPLPEQERIAETLGEMDSLIESLDVQIEKKRLIAKGVAHDLLSGKKRLPGFRGTWGYKRFNEVLIRQTSHRHQLSASEYQETGSFPVIDQGQRSVIAYCDRADLVYRVTEDGAIIFGDHTRIVKYVDFDFVVGADGTQILEAKDASCKYLYFYLQQIDIPNLGYNRHFKFLKNHTYYLPCDIAEQRAIAETLSEMDAAIAALETKREKYMRIKEGVMRDLLTGKVRA